MGSGDTKEKVQRLPTVIKSVRLLSKWSQTASCQGSSEPGCTHREKCVDDVRFDRAEWLVSDQNKDLLLFLKADEVAEPGPLRQPANKQVINM